MSEADRLERLMQDLRGFVSEREWSAYHNPKNLVMLLGSEVGELIAEYRWISDSEADSLAREVSVSTRIKDEIGDVAIALLLLADRLGIDMVDAATEKLEKNRVNYPIVESRGRAERPPTATIE